MGKVRSRYRSVVIVDDDDVDAYINKRLVESAGFASTIHTFLSSREAIDFLRTQADKLEKPAAILLDLYMPEMSGFEMLDKFREITGTGEDIDVIVVSGMHDPREKEYALGYSFVKGYVEKPVTISHLSSFFIP